MLIFNSHGYYRNIIISIAGTTRLRKMHLFGINFKLFIVLVQIKWQQCIKGADKNRTQLCFTEV